MDGWDNDIRPATAHSAAQHLWYVCEILLYFVEIALKLMSILFFSIKSTSGGATCTTGTDSAVMINTFTFGELYWNNKKINHEYQAFKIWKIDDKTQRVIIYIMFSGGSRISQIGGGVKVPKVGITNLIFWPIFPENYMKLKEKWTNGGNMSLVPSLGSAADFAHSEIECNLYRCSANLLPF